MQLTLINSFISCLRKEIRMSFHLLVNRSHCLILKFTPNENKQVKYLKNYVSISLQMHAHDRRENHSKQRPLITAMITTIITNHHHHTTASTALTADTALTAITASTLPWLPKLHWQVQYNSLKVKILLTEAAELIYN